jgi:uncharacterized Zn-binding protein involved in type VI secretion
MPPAARIGAQTPHPGVVTGPGVSTVLIAGLPAAVVGDLHTCSIPAPPGPHPPTPFTSGSTTVTISGRAALRVGDMSGCGAPILVGAMTVEIGG